MRLFTRSPAQVHRLTAVVTGTLLALAFPRGDLSFLAWVCLVPLIRFSRGSRPMQAFRSGALFGSFYFGFLLFWTFPALHRHGRLSWGISLAVFGLLAGYLALFPAVFGAVISRMARGGQNLPLWAAPFVWTFLEWLRSHLFTGFPWGLLGYTQYRFPPMIQVASWTGVYGVSFLVVAINGFLVAAISLPGRKRIVPLGAAAGTLLAVWALGSVSLPAPGIGPVRVAGIQGNVAQERKWEPFYRERILETHFRLTRQALLGGADLVVWPESALPVPFPAVSASEGEGIPGFLEQDTPPVRKRLEELMHGSGVGLLLGAVEYRFRSGERVATNSAQYLSPEGAWEKPYDKVHLVPFVEFVPWKTIFFFLDRLARGTISDFSAGEGPVLHTVKDVRFATAICYEMIFPNLIRSYSRAGAQFLVNITNDGWFDRTGAPYQHFAMCVFRAVENRRWVVRAANTGISGFIDPYGRIPLKTEIFQSEIAISEIQPRDEETIYQILGDGFAWLCGIMSAGMLLMAAMTGRRGGVRRPPP